MNDMRLLKQSIQRWEYEGGALLPADSNVHFWHYRGAETPKPVDGGFVLENERNEHRELADRAPHTK